MGRENEGVTDNERMKVYDRHTVCAVERDRERKS